MQRVIKNGYVATMNADRVVHEHGYVIVSEDGKIGAVGDMEAYPPSFDGEVIDATGMIVIPGLINCGHHPWQNLAMGLPTRPGWQGRSTALRDAARATVTPQAIRASARIAAMESIGGGTTCVVNHALNSRDPDAIAAAIEPMAECGIRQINVLDFQPQPSTATAPSGSAEADRLAALIASYGQGDARLEFALSVPSSAIDVGHGTATEACISAAYKFAVENKLRIFSILSAGRAEQADDYRDALHASGRSDVMHLMELGVLDEHWVLHAGEFLNPTDQRLMKEAGCAATYAPLAESRRGFGTGPWSSLVSLGVPCAIATGDSFLHCSLDMVEHMKAAVLIQNTTNLDATAMSAETVLEMATISAAKAIGLDDRIGSLERGKLADIAVFDLRKPYIQVAHKPITALITCAGGTDANLVMVEGRILVRDGHLVDDTGTENALQALAEGGSPWRETFITALGGRPHATTTRM